ncbi:MAG: single-stranded DNA-binding protein [Phycisphaerales bacterium]|jgi:single-strand DNA-binding protein|nr:single-stranded DNA-binding protein [Phycisphaerales bacterium]
MPNYNKVILAGNMTRDPQLSYTPAQKPVVDFGMAINRKWRGQDGQQHEETCFVDCRAFARTAEVINQYFSKGRPILVEGRLHFSSWEKDGRKHSKLRVTVDSFEFLGSGPGGQGGGGQGGGSYAPQQQQQQQQPYQAPQQQQPQAPPQQQSNYNNEPAPPPMDVGGEDIPF